jgi:hypothetical protein
MFKKNNCPCQSIQKVGRDKLLQEFSAIREQCPALKQILVSDSIWAVFMQKTKDSLDAVGHKYKVLGALQLGILSKITFPIHRYLMDNDHPKADIKNSYKEALIEKWMEKNTTLQRHQKARGHEGKLNELLCASFFEKQGWKIDELEALSGHFDIEATSDKNIQYSIEVKYIGQEDVKFKEVEKSFITKGSIAGTIPIYDGYNYFLFRVYEASKQLSKSTKKRLAIIVFSHNTWQFNGMPINDNWFESRPIVFKKSASKKWDEFFTKKKGESRYRNIENEIEKSIGQLDKIWVLQQKADLDYSIEKCIEIQETN